MPRILTTYIAPSSNVGDSLGIINSNLLSLDIALNNIQTILIQANGMNSYFSDLSSKIPALNNFCEQFSAKQIEYSKTFAAVALLSAYWQNLIIPLDFTIFYPIDVSIPLNDMTNPTGSSVGNGVDVSILNNLAGGTAICLQLLTTQYPATNYRDGTRVNVVLTIYNSLAGVANPVIINRDQLQAFSLGNQAQNAIYNKPGTYFVGNVIETFEKITEDTGTKWSSLSRKISAFNL